MNKTLLIFSALLISHTVSATDFSPKQLTVLKGIVWAADVAEVPRELLLAICWNESTFRTKGVTHMDGSSLSHSVCQVKLETAIWMDKIYKHKILATEARLEDPKINSFYAAKFLKYQLFTYHDNWQLAMDAYNKGTATGSNTKYVKRVKKHIGMFKNLTISGVQH